MRLDKMHTFDKNRILVFNSTNQNEMYQKNLYRKSRKNLENKSGYIQASETEITRLLNPCFRSTGLFVEVYFGNKLVLAPLMIQPSIKKTNL